MCVPISVTVGGTAVSGGLALVAPQIVGMVVLTVLGFLSLTGKRLIK